MPSATLPETSRLGALGALAHAAARRSRDPKLLLDAYEHSHAALVLEPDYGPVLFNHALIAADLGLCRLAEESWQRYLEHDPGSGWAQEAEQRYGLLPCLPDAKHSDSDPDRSFETAFDVLLPRWVAARQERSPVVEILDSISTLGEQLARAGDSTVSELARELRTVSDFDHLNAITSYVNGRKRFEAEDYASARVALELAAPGLKSYRSVLAPWCEIWRAGIDLNVGRFELAETRLDRLGEVSAPHLAGRIHWTLGLSALRSGKLTTANDRFARAADAFARGNFTGARGSIQTLEAETLRHLGFLSQSWGPRLAAIRALQSPRPRFTLHNALLDGALVAQDLGFSATADAFLFEAAAAAKDSGNPLSATEVSLLRARILHRRSEHASAAALFRETLRSAREIPYERPRKWFEHSARLGLWADARDAEIRERSELDELVRFFALHGPASLTLQALRIKAGYEYRLGETAEARRTFDQAIGVIRAQRGNLGGDRIEISYLDSIQEIFDQAIDQALSENLPLRALELLETARQMPASDALVEFRELRLSTGAVATDARDLPVIVVFGLIKDSFVWWRIDGNVVTHGIGDAQEVETAAAAVVDRLEDRHLSAGALVSLFRLLLASPLRGVAPDRSIIIIPDGILQRVPFAALRNPMTGRYLLEERALSLSSSLRTALEPRHERRRQSDWRIAVIGDPAFDSTRLPWLDRLPGSAREAQRISELYGARAELLTGEAATAENLRRAIQDVDVLHLAAHAHPDADPFRDTFALAATSGTGSSGLITADALMRGIAAPDLVVLSACSTLGRHPSRAGGLLGLARSFVRLGARATVGTLKPLDDRLLERLMIEFHSGLRDGLAASEALRRAQLRVLDSAKSCCDWAAIQVIGDLPADPIVAIP